MTSSLITTSMALLNESIVTSASASIATSIGTSMSAVGDSPTSIVGIAIYIGAAMLLIAMTLTIARLIKGPTVPDRILALDTLAINGIALLVLFSIHAGHAHNFEVVLLIAMTGFIGTVAFCKFLLRGDIIE